MITLFNIIKVILVIIAIISAIVGFLYIGCSKTEHEIFHALEYEKKGCLNLASAVMSTLILIFLII